MKYIIYCRKASEHKGKEIGSLWDQERRLHEYARQRHLDVVAMFLENESGTAIERPLYGHMMSMIENGIADGILVTDMNRISRNYLVVGKIMSLIESGIIKEIRTPRYVINGLV